MDHPPMNCAALLAGPFPGKGRQGQTCDRVGRCGIRSIPVFPVGRAVLVNAPTGRKWNTAMYNLLMKSSLDYNEWAENQGRPYDVSRLVERFLRIYG